jgi:hypothetical protein
MTDVGWQDRSRLGSRLRFVAASVFRSIRVRQAESLSDRQVVMNASRPEMLIPAERCESFTQGAKNDAQHVHRRRGTVVGRS